MANVLLVEDEEVQRKALETILRSGNHQVLLASNGAQALLVAMDKRPDIVVADYNTPKVTGAELCKKIRAEPTLDGTYLLVITAGEGDALRIDSILAGADDFLRKPVQPEELLNRVEIGLKIRELRRESAALRLKAEVLGGTQEALVTALDAAVRGYEAAAARFAQMDPDGAHEALRASHEELRLALARVVLPDEGA
jgi:DNA-binding response OmpR family regulator